MLAREGTFLSRTASQRVLGAVFISAAVGSAVCNRGSDVSPSANTALAKSEAFIDAFYSFDSTRLKAALSSADGSIPQIVYYQGWAQGGNYEIVARPACMVSATDTITCPVTVKDDLIVALGLPMHVTDTFRIAFANGQITSVSTSSNDPELFHEAMKWMQTERKAQIAEPCRGFFDGGPTPGDCVRAMVNGFRNYAARQQNTAPRRDSTPQVQ
jgi:hypothetical protein